jgi:drug/metabolite transporter (DMT)-like permease
MGPLQIAPPDIPEWAQLLSQGLGFLTALVGLAIAYQAYRGYRRNQSRPMLFLAIGFVLSVGLPFVMVIPLLLFSHIQTVTAILAVLGNVFTLIGLACILYALRMPTEGSG